MKGIAAFLFVVIAPVVFPAPAHADMYRWTDKAGITHFSTEPGDPSAVLMREKDLPPVSETGEASSSNPAPGKTYYPGGITAMVHLVFDGRPLSEITSVSAVIRLYSQRLKQWFTPDYSYDAGTGTVRLRGIAEGTYSGQATVDANPSNPDLYPGDYKGNFFIDALQSSPAVVTAFMERIMHLTSPEDNGVPLAEWSPGCSNKREFETPVVIAWESLGKGVSYGYSIVRTVCQPFAFKESVAADRTEETRLVIDLPPNKEGEFYTLRIEAQKNDKPVGSLMTHGNNGWGWDYRFRVLSRRGPTRVISPIGVQQERSN